GGVDTDGGLSAGSSAGNIGAGLTNAGSGAGAALVHEALSSAWPDFSGSPSYSAHGRPNAYSTGSSVTKGTGQGGANKFETPMPSGPGASPSLAKDPPRDP